MEPASAASVAGLLKCRSGSRCDACPMTGVADGARVVLTVTGHGLKDPDVAKDQIGGVLSSPALRDDVLRVIGL